MVKFRRFRERTEGLKPNEQGANNFRTPCKCDEGAIQTPMGLTSYGLRKLEFMCPVNSLRVIRTGMMIACIAALIPTVRKR